MVSLEKLKQIREREGNILKKMGNNLKEKRQKKKIKEDIRKIKSAKLRNKFGIESGNIADIGKNLKSSLKGSGKVLKTSFKLLGALSQSADDYYRYNKPKRRKKKK